MTNHIPLYRSLANEFESQIESGVFIPGEKMPSVRNTAEMRKISVITVLKAYQILEQKGLIHSMPKSGYYIAFHNTRKNQQQETIAPQEVHVFDLIRNYTRESANTSGLLGTGLPARDIVPIQQMNRILIHELRLEEFQQLRVVQGEGDDLFRAQIVKYLMMKNLSPSKDNVLISNGCTESIYLCLHSLCNPGDQIAMQSPCSFGILQMAETMKLKVLEIPPDETDGIDVAHLQYILENYEIKAVYLNPNVNNPLGTILSADAKKAIADLANEKKVFVIEDDVMSDLCYDSNLPLPIKAYDTGGYVIHCSSFTKTLLPTYRVGWVYSDLLSERIIQYKRALNVGTPLLQQAVISELLESGNYFKYIRKARSLYAERTARLRNDLVSSFPRESSISTPEGGYLLWVKLPESVPADTFFNRLLAENISVLPGIIFSPNNRYADCFRINSANYGEQERAIILRMGEIASDLARSNY